MKTKDKKNEMVPVMVDKNAASFIKSIRDEEEKALSYFSDAIRDLTHLVLLHKEQIDKEYHEKLDNSLIHLSYLVDHLEKFEITQ
jgi:transcription termination factor NusB